MFGKGGAGGQEEQGGTARKDGMNEREKERIEMKTESRDDARPCRLVLWTFLFFCSSVPPCRDCVLDQKSVEWCQPASCSAFLASKIALPQLPFRSPTPAPSRHPLTRQSMAKTTGNAGALLACTAFIHLPYILSAITTFLTVAVVHVLCSYKEEKERS